MTTSVSDWLEGARIRTLPAAVAPVIAGAAIAFTEDSFSWLRTLLAAAVALFLQVGVNFSNDYSDGVRGTDEFRSGPPRLTGGGKVKPKIVLIVAFAFFGAAGLMGLALVALSGQWWLLTVGALAILAAWFYTGGSHPYGYIGLGEIFVLVFFGYVATVGTVYTQSNTAPLVAWIVATGIGVIACALLMVNNIRDIPTDIKANKRTLAVRLGDTRARKTFVGMVAFAPLLTALTSFFTFPILAVTGLLLFVVPNLSRPVRTGKTGRDLIIVLRNTGFFELAYALLVGALLLAA
ncbi:1,4-dihydroxy-2-naphthoate octaprenyltransferase [Arcanobacterium pluranimalium]|uniref:1,4-dihydroxy-2-naphthoate polyprenyltransferase n=1 Tax=Arcanobacterium pluranimalium TaxID=108028 RepID=UPI00195C4013|nr:1,4-dihydroxy-2-naphthoate polyprenyltransferase [Arcanobacterium pluranimalium]MBM7825904.1 1,4-dihydroxy-2-naphthoate octaprenyltransferase [Arcanobacterium pluranimalium]